ncbi:MAG TPA: diguanylate cyclase [Acidimicrobiales bacterium]|nr:diguanylate cyclase [Acidimicrobiales bacterium]
MNGADEDGVGAGPQPAPAGLMDGELSRPPIERWLAAHPAAELCAMSPEGTPVPMPADVPLMGSHRVDGLPLLDRVAPADAEKVASTFVQALRQGVATVNLEVVERPGERLTVHYVDTRSTYGVLLRVVLPAGADDAGRADDAPGADDTAGAGPDGGPSARRARPPAPPPPPAPPRPRLAVVRKSTVSTIVEVDAATTAMLGWSAEEMVGRQTLDFIHPDDQARAIDNWMELIGRGGRHAIRVRYRRNDGSWLWLETSNDLRDEGGEVPSVVCQMIDISDEMAASEALRYNEALLRRVTETVPVGLAELATDRSITYCNARLHELLAQYDIESIDDLLGSLPPEDAMLLDSAITRALDDGVDADVDVRLVGPLPGADRLCRVTLRAVCDDGLVRAALLCVVDVTELKVQATTDPLTGLDNRSAIVRALRAALAGSSGLVGVVFVDLDRFKPVNDLFGHDAGDRLLVDVARALRRAVRPGDSVGRLGGDEFLVVCPRLESEGAALGLARRLHACVREGLEGSAGGLVLDASVGVACVEPGSVSAEEAMTRADTAMYSAKRTLAGQPRLWKAPD